VPLGSHRHPMRHDADLSLRGHVRLVAEFLERVDLRDVTLVQNDVGIGLVLAGEGPERVARLVLASTEAFDNYPPGLPGRMLLLAARVPGGPMLSQPAIRRDLEKYVRSTDRSAMIAASERLRSFQRPALVVWAAEDHVMPVEHGHRLADLLPQGRFVEIGDSYTLIPEDRPDALAELVSDFVADTSSIDAEMTAPGRAV
jgi:pimeloyl-ACP methyl ester carboxylesterase